MIIGNVVDSNLGDGITSGGMGHAAGKYALNNIFASNFITNNVGHNGGQVDVAHGKVRINPCGGGGVVVVVVPSRTGSQSVYGMPFAAAPRN
jgi:hypothetical protein